MKKINLFFVIVSTILLTATSSYAQEKQTIAIAPFSYIKGSINEGDLKKVEAQVEKNVAELKRFQLVNRQDMVALDNERATMQGADFVDGRYIEQGKKLGAQLMVFGRVNSVVNRPQGKENANNNIAIINVTIKIVDVTTTAEIANTTIEPNSGKNASQATGTTKTLTKLFDRTTGSNTKEIATSTTDIIARSPEQAMSKAIENIDDDLRPFLIETFPSKYEIAQILEKKDEKAKVILILGGKAAGIKKGDKLNVVELTEMNVAGKKFIRNVQIASLTVDQVEDENFSKCNVTSGGAELTTKFDGKAKIKAVEIPKAEKKI